MTAIEQLLSHAKHTDPELYAQAVLELYVAKHGPHYDEGTAREAVERLHSKNPDGQVVTGEHWDYDQVVEAMQPYADDMSDCDTFWDAYVALNMWWHALRMQYGKRTGNPDPWIIEDAAAWAFMEGQDGLVWKYMHAVA